jgi:hypothetical protein
MRTQASPVGLEVVSVFWADFQPKGSTKYVDTYSSNKVKKVKRAVVCITWRNRQTNQD